MLRLFSNKTLQKNTPTTKGGVLFVTKGGFTRFALVAMVAVLLVSMLANLTNSMPTQALTAGACAIGGNFVPQDGGVCTPKLEATSYSYYQTLGLCVQHNMGQGSPNFPVAVSENGNATTAEMFDDNNAWGNIYPGGTKTDCKDIMSKALKLWGWTGTTQTFLTAMGNTYKVDTGNGTAQYIGISDETARLKGFQKAVQNQAYGGSAPTLSAAATYVMDLDAFTANGGSCSSKDMGLYTSLNSTIKKLVDAGSPADASTVSDLPAGTIGSALYTHIMTVGSIADASGKTSWTTNDHVYVYLASTSTPSRFSANTAQTSQILYGYHTNQKTVNCSDLAKFLGKASNATALKNWDRDNSAAASTDAKGSCHNGATPDANGNCPGANATTCAIDNIGWIVCPVVNFLASIADGAFAFLANNFLQTDSKLLDTSSATYSAWSVMRTIANVAFVIAFLIIIFSQITGFGVSNYGVKKMLPRIVVAAILVNISFFISQLAVDVSNILGFSIKDVFNNLTATVNKNTVSDALSQGANPIATGSGFAGIAGSVLAVAAVGVGGYAMLSTLIPVLLAAVLALVLILFILVARQAIVVLLIVLSPLAFVAFLLPNTQGLFKQWRKMLTAMLLLFPIIAIVFGASTLASQILTHTFDGSIAGDNSNMFGEIIAAAVLVLPLFVVPVLLKKSLDSIPVLGQMASKFAGRANGNLSKKANESYKGSLVGRGLAYRKAGTEAYRSRKFAKRVSDGGFAGKVAGGIAVTPAGIAGQKSLVKSAVAASLKAEDEEVQAAKAIFTNANMNSADRMKLAMEGAVTITDASGKKHSLSGEVMQRAAIQEVLQKGSYGEQARVLEQSSANGALAKYSQTISLGVQANGLGSKDPALAGKRLEELAQGTFNYDKAVADAAREGKYTGTAFASMNEDARDRVIKVAQTAQAAGDPSVMNALRKAVTDINSSPEIRATMGTSEKTTKQFAVLGGGGTAGTLILPGDEEFKVR